MSSKKAKLVVKGEKGLSRDKTVAGSVVSVNHVTQHGPNGGNGPQYYMTWRFDFTDVTDDERLLEAVRSDLIDYRGDWKKLPLEDAEGWGDVTIKMRDVIDARRTRKPKPTPEQEVKSGMAKLTPEQRKKLLAELAAMDE